MGACESVNGNQGGVSSFRSIKGLIPNPHLLFTNNYKFDIKNYCRDGFFSHNDYLYYFSNFPSLNFLQNILLLMYKAHAKNANQLFAISTPIKHN